MTNPHQQFYDAGVQAEKMNVNVYEHYKTVFGHEPKGGSGEWTACLNGRESVRAKVNLAKREAYHVNEFLVKLRALLAEYDASISFGESDGGLMVKDLEVGYP
jgi:hypothetical protein